mgnify:CR=1 FL=1|tara:strand:- start:435 stop:1217 length:783 start_codon:yes stop_codon:yes gene_type:complete
MSQLLSESMSPAIEGDLHITDTEAECRECSTSIPWNSTLIKIGGPRSVVCDDCCNASKLSHEQAEKETSDNPYTPQQPLETLIPALYLNSDPKKLPKDAQEALPQVLAWRPGPTGLYLLGNTRAGKTRCLCMLLEQLHSQRVQFKAFFPGEFHTDLTDAKRGKDYYRWKKRITTIPVLAIDDLFSEKLTATTEAGYFEILDARIGKRLPTLITTQMRSKDLVQIVENPARAQALSARLKESCKAIILNRDLNQETLQLAS